MNKTTTKEKPTCNFAEPVPDWDLYKIFSLFFLTYGPPKPLSGVINRVKFLPYLLREILDINKSGKNFTVFTYVAMDPVGSPHGRTT